MAKTSRQEWLLAFYSVPSHPVSGRMKIWRKLSKAGAVQLKGAVYILPATEDHEEFFQWLIGEVKALGGDGAFVRSAGIETMSEADIRELFIRQIEKEYLGLDKPLDALERKAQSIRKGTRLEDKGGLTGRLNRMSGVFEDIRKRDFFDSRRGDETGKRIRALEAAIKGMEKTVGSGVAAVARRRADQYKGRTWVTRKRPFVDRMASAWLIRKFIDPAAAFRFIDEREAGGIKPKETTFDIKDGEFTHQGDLCTFEVLVKAFDVRDKAIKKIAEIVHELDVKDEKYRNAESSGVEDILIGIRKTGKDDADALDRGMAVFEMMYRSKT